MDRYNATSREARVEANLLRQANRQLSMQMTVSHWHDFHSPAVTTALTASARSPVL
ncbi:MAG: hypothetical protein NTW20_00900 [Rhodobacterales bacterium]|nr:hypothetical protein [Rhodobacterales bacterium]